MTPTPLARGLALIGGGLALSFALAASAADTWPAKPITFVVPSSPGGGTDIYARLLAEGVGKQLKQTVVVENKPGASGNIGAAAAARATPDGYTFLVSATPAIAVNPYLYKNLPYDAEKDLVPVARGVDAPLVYVVPPGSRFKTLDDLLAAGKSEPGKLAFGSAGHGSPTFLGVKVMEEKTGAAFTHVPYKGMAPTMQDFLGGRLDFLQSDVASVLPHIKSGKAVPLAISSKSPLFPKVAVWTDKGLPDVPQSFSVMAPAGTPDAIVQKMSQTVVKAMQEPSVKQRLIDQGYLPVSDTPARFSQQLTAERAMWKSLIERNHITVE
ncbi:tripartite tricarboxylate transporter substrate binding protein [Pigmentiphaga sp. H8]|uniref:Bug family tripartite tricarboxylate transporter substrate binding protein n=1 Tax=Pigmentiphaga sp. H8 TaxID=2488560 RepID=UPI000F59045B|nr:tripartite tricarboxylate transporter substrate binding protein [Pigmentiphaga sp. H8]AZG09419.1 tripartite tricarboxylate transporter substrate binding protein [Pigmentiphaga sp. H8]